MTYKLKGTAQKAAIERMKWVAALPLRKRIARLRELDEAGFWEFQLVQLQKIYGDAIRHVPYYRDHSDEYPRTLENAADVQEALAQLPILPKGVVKAQTDQFWRQPPLLGTFQHTTGGTSGTPLRVRASVKERGFTPAILDDRYAHIVGTPTPRILRMSGYLDRTTGGDSLFQSIPGTKYAYLSIYSLSQTNRDAILDALGSFRPQVIRGYASALHQLALLFKEDPLPLSVEPFVVVTTSGTTTPQQRDDIEQYLRTRVFDEYGSQEGQHLVVECDHGTKHIHPARGIVELLAMDADHPALPGELGRVVVTGLMNRTMPLIRYELGDTAVSTGYQNDCACGLRWPSIGVVYGRMEDLVQTRDGRRIGLLSHSTLKDVEGIQESQIIQTGYGEFTYRIVPQDPLTFDRTVIEEHVRRELRNRLQENVSVVFEYPGEIERTKNGKLQAVVVRLQEEESRDKEAVAGIEPE